MRARLCGLALALAGLGAAAGVPACSESLRVDLDSFCEERPFDVECGGRGGTSGAAGSGAAGSGTAGTAGAGGGPLSCALPSVACGASCVDVESDTRHCGGCGYACDAGASCSRGACAPTVLAASVSAPYALAIDATHLYFVTPTKTNLGALPHPVQRVPRGGGVPTPIFGVGSFVRARALALREGTLFFSDIAGEGEILSGPADGSAGYGTYFNEKQPRLQHLIAAESRLWWSTFDGSSRVRHAAATAPPATAADLTAEAAQVGEVPSLAIEGGGPNAIAYWVNRGNSTTQQQNGLWRRSIEAESTAPERLLAGGALFDLALGDDAIYVADAVAGIGKVEKAATVQAFVPLVREADIGGTLLGIAFSAGNLYWLSLDGVQLVVNRSARDGSNARAIGRTPVKSAAYWSNPFGPARLLIDSGYIYFSDPGTFDGDTASADLEGVASRGDGAIYRLPQ